jgi:ribose transport system substrate-binding protein
MGMLRNGLNLLNVPSAWEGVVIGVVLVLAVIFDRLRQQNTTQTQVQKKIKNKILVPSLLILAFFFAFNHRLEQPANSQQPTVIALITKANGSSYWQRMQAGAEEEAKKHHIKLLTMAPDKETDVERQYQLIENAIQQKVAAILLAPAGTKELITAIKKANQANIPVLLLDTKIDRKEAQRLAVQVESFIGSDNFKGGELAGKALAESIYFTGSVGIIEGISGHETAESRRLGFLHALHEYPEIKVVASQTAHWERERSYSVTQNMLQTHPDIRAIFCASDEMAMGSVEALRALQRKDVVIVGFDANPDALAYVINKKITATVAQSPRYMGMKGVYYAHQLLQHKIIPPAIHPTPLNLVTANNAQKFVF